MTSNMLLRLLNSNQVQIPASISYSPSSKFHKDREVDPVLDFLQIWRKARHKCSRRSANIFDDGSSGTGRCNSSGSREVRHIRRAVIELPAECNVLAGHVVKRAGSVPGLERVSRIFGEVRRARGRCRAIDRGQQHQIASRIIDFAAAQRQTVAVMVKPETVVEHEAQEILFRALGGVAVAAY